MCTWCSFICYVSTFLPLYLSLSFCLSISFCLSSILTSIMCCLVVFFLHLHDIPLSFCRPHSSTSDVSLQSSSILSHSFFTSALLKKNSLHLSRKCPIIVDRFLRYVPKHRSIYLLTTFDWLSECVCVFGMSFVSECAQIQAFSSANRGIAEETLA